MVRSMPIANFQRSARVNWTTPGQTPGQPARPWFAKEPLKPGPLKFWGHAFLTAGAVLATVAFTPVRSWAAEQLFFDFGPLNRSIPVASLEHFAETGEVDAALAPYFRKLTPAQQADLKTALTTTKAVDVVTVSQFFYDPMGARSLDFMGNVIQTDGFLNGGKALRSAIITSAANGEISLLSVLQNFPSRTIQLDLEGILKLVRQTKAEVEATQALLKAVAAQSAADAALPPPLDLAALPDLTQPGPYGMRRIDLTLVDPARQNRTVPVIVFVPENLAAAPSSLPVVVVSHGLGSSPNDFLEAGVIASYGFVVALPDHIGSDTVQKQALLDGLSDEMFKVSEFLDRPLDITFLLDELERTNQSQYQGKLNLDQVLLVGHSFGGYTALAIAGATIDFDQLAQACTPEQNILLDAAQLLECRALELDPVAVQRLGVEGVRDERVKIIVPFAPVSNLFGQSGISRIQIPVAMSAGTVDVAAPAMPEQATTFTWLTTPDKYLYLIQNASHNASLTEMVDKFLHVQNSYDQSSQEELVLVQELSRTLVVAFAQVYLNNDQTYAPFLRSAYVEAVSQEPFKRYLVRELPD